MSEKNDIMDRYFRGEFIDRQAIKALEQESCEDAISRQAVLDVVEREQFKGDAISEIEKLPSVKPQEPKWIPVSVRLPEKSGRYLAYIINSHDDKLRYVMTCDYSADGYWNWFPDDECASDNVIAWMPLPTPYEPQERSDKECTKKI